MQIETITPTNVFKVIPEHLGLGFGFCVFGDVDEQTLNIARECNFEICPSLSTEGKKYTNFFPTKETDYRKMFPSIKKFRFMDGFSPNLNKYLHIGHFSNLVLAKAFQSMDMAEQYVSILGDTLTGDVSKEEAHAKFKEYCKQFNYKVDMTLMASLMEYNGQLSDGEGEYAGTKIIQAGEEKIVVIKKDGSTSYFYQDMALASLLGQDTLYLTGYEQENHFKILKQIFPHVHHIGLGLVKFQEKNKLDADSAKGKMSTRLGNVIYLSDLMKQLKQEFNNNEELCYNIFAGYILKNNPHSDKVFSMDTIKNPKNSPGLYLSYTMARLQSAGVEIVKQDDFVKPMLKFNFLKSQATLNPSCLFQALVELCQEINGLYIKHHISDNEINKKMFETLLGDLALGMKKIGMFEVKEV